jgi:hypothetical protein
MVSKVQESLGDGGEFFVASQAVIANLEEITSNKQQIASADLASGTSGADTSKRIMIMITILCVLLTAFYDVLIVESIVKPVNVMGYGYR